MGQLSSAEARVRLAEINLKQAQIDYDREENLYNMKLVSADEYDKVKQSLHQAKEEKVAAIDALQVVRDGVSKSNASASSTLIRSTISGRILGALQDLKFDANLEYISPKAVENNGANQFEIKAAVKLAEGSQIRSGYSANAEIVLSSVSKVLSVPESAIEFSGDSTFVYIIKGEGKDKTYERTQVTTGLSDGVNIEIKKGVTQKDKVRGPEKINDEDKK